MNTSQWYFLSKRFFVRWQWKNCLFYPLASKWLEHLRHQRQLPPDPYSWKATKKERSVPSSQHVKYQPHYCYYDCFRKRPFKQLFANTYRVNNHGQFVNNEYISILLRFHIAQRTSWRWEHLEVAHWNHVKLSLTRQAGAVDSLAVWMFKNTFITKLQL